LSRITAAVSGRQRMTVPARPFNLQYQRTNRGAALPEPDAIVFVVDDDVSVREALENLMRSVGLRVESFPSAREFLARRHGDEPGCLVLDVRLPDLGGLDLQ